MGTSPAAPWVWFWIVIHALGLVSAVLARVGSDGRLGTACQALYFGLLCLVGLGAGAALAVNPSAWLVSSTTFAAMLLTATIDFQPRRQVTQA